MFGLLKDKLSGFVNKLIKREEDKPTPAQAPPAQVPPTQEQPAEKKKAEPVVQTTKPVSQPVAKKEETKKHEQKEEKKPEPKKEKEEQKKHEPEHKKHEPKHEEKAHKKEEPKRHEQKEEPKRHEPKEEQKKSEPKPEPKKTEPIHAPKPQPIQTAPKPEPQPIAEIKPAVSESKPIEIETKPIELEKIPTAPQPEPKKNILSSIWPFGGKKKEEPVAIQETKTESVARQDTAPVKPASKPASTIITSSAPKPAAISSSTAHPTSTSKPDLQLEVPESVLNESEMARLEKKALSDEEREMKVKMGLGKSVLGFLAPQVTIEENDVRDLLDDLEMALLESDVDLDVSTEVTQRLKKKLVGMKVEKGKMQQEVQKQMKGVLADIMTSTSSFDFIERVQQRPKPVKILFVGPNGAGKTTTMAKIAQRLMEAKMSVVFAAGDTFRAAAIEQTEVHAKRLGIPVIKSNYGADPASVAFDAVNYAKAHKTDVVLIDSAGRQDTNANLLDELKKINRVISPDLKIYIGESIGGHALAEQIRAFHSAIGIDGAILTKLDCDAKGGTAISLTYATGVPILFLGTGQAYEDLKPFDAQWVAEQILT